MNWTRTRILLALIFVIGVKVTKATDEVEEILTTSTQISITEESENLITTTEVFETETTTELQEEETTPTTVIDLETSTSTTTEQHIKKPEIPLPEYAIKQMNSILNHILEASYRFVTEVLQETTANDATAETFPREKLKTYAELLLRLLHIDDELEYDEDYHYNLMLKKLSFLKGRTTKYLSTYLPEDWVEVYNKNKEDISVWVDESAEELHDTFRSYISDEDDHVKYQYFNEGFDDLLRANLIQQKLTILLDLIKVAANKKKVSFTDIYVL